MSGPPVQPRSRELEIVRVLFDKHLLERAVNLAEARWAGSGEMVRLAYHWQDLGPADRRQRLEAIGPEQLSRFRELAELDPELAKVLDTLEERGVLTPAAAQASETPAAAPSPSAAGTADAPSHPIPAPAARHEPVVRVEADPVSEAEITLDVPSSPDTSTFGGSGWNPAARLDHDGEIAARISSIDLPDFDSDKYRRAEQERRAEAVQSGEELLRRVRARLDSTARRVTSNPIGSGASPSTLPQHVPARLPGSSAAAVVADEHEFVPPPDYWLRRLKDEVVVYADPNTRIPSDDELVALANELGLELSDFVAEAGTTRALFGGLKRSGSKVDVKVGPLPAALSYPSLVVVRGHLFPRIVQRLNEGMCDIPGTNATVRIDPKSRVLIVQRGT